MLLAPVNAAQKENVHQQRCDLPHAADVRTYDQGLQFRRLLGTFGFCDGRKLDGVDRLVSAV